MEIGLIRYNFCDSWEQYKVVLFKLWGKSTQVLHKNNKLWELRLLMNYKLHENINGKEV
jgi:hypothetical protein